MISIDGVTLERGGSPVVRNVSFVVPAGSWCAVVGPNGAGKSSLLGAMSGMIRPASGSIRVNDDQIADLPVKQRARVVALMPQRPSLPPHMTTAEYVMLGRTAHLGMFGREGASDHEAVAGLMERLDLRWFAARPISTLSGGELQRAVLARALAQEPSVLLLDEPTSALDIAHQQQALDLVDALRIERGLTIMSAIHDLTLAAAFADNVALIACGELIAHGPPAEVITQSSIAGAYGAQVEVLQTDRGPVVIPRRSVRVES